MPWLTKSRVTNDFDRIAPFTDAVVAVALTALVLPLLDIKVDESAGWTAFIKEYGSQFAAFFFGFLVIAIYWVVHHKIWGTARACTSLLLWLNLLWLLGIVLIPFGTVALNESGGETPIFGAEIYCAIMLVTCVALGLIIYIVANDPRVGDGSIGPQKFWWTMRLAAVWAIVWVALATTSVGFTLLTWAGVAMGVLGALPAPGSKKWAEQQAIAGQAAGDQSGGEQASP